MESRPSIEDRISTRYGALSGKLQAAADYVMQSPIEVATRSLRSVAAASGLAPSTFSRLARALDFETYEELRELSRDAIGRRAVTFSDKARSLRTQAENEAAARQSLLYRQAAACIQNIEDLSNMVDDEKLERVVARLKGSRKVTLLGSLGSRGVIDYMHYIAGWITDNWVMADEGGPDLAIMAADATPDDALVLISKPKFAKTVMRAGQMAAEKGAFLVVITDTHTCPALEFASESFIVPSDSPHFFTSYVSTMMLVETMMSMLVAQSGPEAEARIKEIETYTESLGQYWTS